MYTYIITLVCMLSLTALLCLEPQENATIRGMRPSHAMQLRNAKHANQRHQNYLRSERRQLELEPMLRVPDLDAGYDATEGFEQNRRTPRQV